MGSGSVPTTPVRFGVFEADLSAGELRRNGVKVRLQDLPFRTLALLLARPGEVISREEFRQALWPADVFVDFEQGISSAVMRLRDALRDSADNPVFIETIERRGYRWIGPIHPSVSMAQAAPPQAEDDAAHEPPTQTAPPDRSTAIAFRLVAEADLCATRTGPAFRCVDLPPRQSQRRRRRDVAVQAALWQGAAFSCPPRGRGLLPQRPFLLEQTHS